MQVNSPDINVLDFQVLWDLSQVNPVIKLTNQSSGPNLNLDWWYEITTPSGATIHKGTAASPDVTNNTWATITVPDTWPQPFGQVEFNKAPYKITLYVKDDQGTTFSLAKEQIICRPAGLLPSAGNNFGVANISFQTRCDAAELYVEDVTVYNEQNISGALYSKKFVLDYPPHPNTGERPAAYVKESDFTNLLIPLTYDGDGYGMYVDSVVDYLFLDGTSIVRYKYKYQNRNFSILCNIDFCQIYCAFKQLSDEVNAADCSTVKLQEKQKVLNEVTVYIMQLFILKSQPGCSDSQAISELIDKIRNVSGFDCNCFTPSGLNTKIATGGLNVTFEQCGDITAEVVEQDGSNIKFRFKDKSYIVNLTETAEEEGLSIAVEDDPITCTKTYTIDFVPPVASGGCPVKNTLAKHNVTPDEAPDDCPATKWPKVVYDINDQNVIGVAKNLQELVELVNINVEYNDVGIAIAIGGCVLGWLCTENPPVVHVEDEEEGPNPCIDGVRTYELNLLDSCNNSVLSSLDFPFDAEVSYATGGPRYIIANVTSYNDLLSKLKAEPNIPTHVDYSANANQNKVNVLILDDDCLLENETVIYANRDLNVVFGANHHSAVPNNGGINILDMNNKTQLGKLCQPNMDTDYPWHIVKVGNFLYTVVTDTGMLYKIDVSNALQVPNPTGVQLPQTASPFAAFSGMPLFNGSFSSHWDVYFPTDLNYFMNGSILYIVESSSANIWAYDTVTDSVLGFFHVEYLYAKCPRAIFEGKLYLTMDGNRLGKIGQTDTYATHDKLYILDLNVFSPAGFTDVTIGTDNTDEIWAMTVDPADPQYAYLTSYKGLIYKFDMISNLVVASYGKKWDPSTGTFVEFCNTHIYDDVLYVSGHGYGTQFIPFANLTDPPGTNDATNFEPLVPPAPGGANVLHYNVYKVPGRCYCLVTYDNTFNPGGIAKYTMDGKFIDLVDVTPTGDIFNVVAIGDYPNTSNNNYC